MGGEKVAEDGRKYRPLETEVEKSRREEAGEEEAEERKLHSEMVPLES